MEENLNFHEATKHIRGKLSGHIWDWRNPPEIYKRYEDVSTIELPSPKKEGGMGIWEAIARRRSIRDFSSSPMTLQQLSQLLWATQGITGTFSGYDFRAAPSAGALYPIETYLVVNNVLELERGVYHLNVKDFTLELIKQGDFTKDVSRAALDQDMAGNSEVTFLWSAIIKRTTWKYGKRGFRYIYKDAAHICGNLYLAATALNLGCCGIGACFDNELNEILGLDGTEETIVYMACIGKI